MGENMADKNGTAQPVISNRLKKKRLQAGISIRELARRTGLTASFISQVENEKANVSLDSLRRIAEALGVQMLYFLSEFDQANGHELRAVTEASITTGGMEEAQNLMDRTHPLIKSQMRPRMFLPDAGITYELLTSRLDHKMESFLGRMNPGTGNVGNKLSIPTEEFIFVISGALRVGIGDIIYLVEAGDSIYFNGQELTCLASGSDTEETVWLSVVTPPAF
jgi:transcriptional regulator with XRE-family HTH domain